MKLPARLRVVLAGSVLGGLLVVAAAAGAPPPAPGEPEPAYPVGEFDLCERIDLAPLQDLSVTVWDLVARPGPGRPDLGQECRVSMRNAAGDAVYLKVESELAETVRFARSEIHPRTSMALLVADLYGEAYSEVRTSTEVTGIGEQARAYRQATPRTTNQETFYEYGLTARNSNLVLRVRLGVESRSTVVWSRLVVPVHQLTAGLFASVPPAPPPEATPMGGRTYRAVAEPLCEHIDLGPVTATAPSTMEPTGTHESESDGHQHVDCSLVLRGDGTYRVRMALAVSVFRGSSMFWAHHEYDRCAGSGEPVDAGGAADRAAASVLSAHNYRLCLVRGNLTIGISTGGDVFRDGERIPMAELAEELLDVAASIVDLFVVVRDT